MSLTQTKPSYVALPYNAMVINDRERFNDRLTLDGDGLHVVSGNGSSATFHLVDGATGEVNKRLVKLVINALEGYVGDDK